MQTKKSSKIIKNNQDLNWYLIRTKHNQEKRAKKELERQDVIVFLPLYRHEIMKNGKKVIKDEPLFSMYLFINFDPTKTYWSSIRSTRGVASLVQFGSDPAIVQKEIIEDLKKCDLQVPEPYFKTGKKIKVIDGPLKNIEGVYQIADGNERSYILLSFMEQNQYIRVNNDLIVNTES